MGTWRSKFSAEEFANAFPSPDPRKVLHDMTSKGLLERIDRGLYRVRTPKSYLSLRYSIDEGYNLLRNATDPYALIGVDGVFAWTRGGYNANRFFGSYPIFIKVRKSDAEAWKAYFTRNGKRFIEENTRPSETLYGVYFVIRFATTVESDTIVGLRVEKLKDVVGFCRNDPYTYAPALEMLDKEYNLGIGARYAD